MTYTFEPYDVLQIKSRDGSSWLDFSTLRTESEGRQAVSLVDQGSWEGKPAEFRITRFAMGQGHVPVYEKTPAAPIPTLSETQVDGLIYYLEQKDRHGRAVRAPLWQTRRSLLRLGLIERLWDREGRSLGDDLTPAAYGAIAHYAPEAL